MAATKGKSSTKAKDSPFDRGFKTWCENTAVSTRKKLGLDAVSPLPPADLADALGVTVWELDQIPGLPETTRRHLESAEGNQWSAVTVVVQGREIVVTNPTHSPARQSTNLMHELAHVLLKHEAAAMYISDSGYAIRHFDDKQEKEADWLADTLLLPRTVLAHCAYKRIPTDQILTDFVVSKQLYNFRMRMTGVGKQYRRY